MKKIMIYIFLFLSLVTLSSCSFDDTYIINQDVQTIAIGEKTVLKLSNDIGDVTWKSSNEAIATVDEFGVVTGISGGIVTITATVENNTYSIMVSVDAKKSDPIIVISGNQTIYVGETTTLTAKVFNATIEENLLWSSNNEKIATVDEKGVVTGIAPGMVTITVKAVTDRLIEETYTVLIRSENNILEDTVNNYIESNIIKIDGTLDLTALNEKTVKVVEDNYQSTIGVSNYVYYTSRPGVQTLELNGIGTGIIFKREKLENDEYMYYALTNYHVIKDAAVIKAFLGDKDIEIQASAPLNSKSLDLAVIAFRYDKDIPLAKLGQMDTVKNGQFVIALGNPTGYEYYGSATFGMISYVNRKLTNETANFIQHDAAINPGNSGGPLFNLNGEVIGINTIKLATEDIDNIGFSVAIDTIRHFLSSGNITID